MKILDTPRSGKCGQEVAFNSRFGLCLREYTIPSNPRSPAQQHVREIFSSVSRMWSGTLTEEQQDRWNAAGPQVLSHPQLSTRGPLTGQELCQSVNCIRRFIGLAPTLEPPAPVGFGPSPAGPLEITNDEDGVRLWLTVTGELNEDIMVFGAAPCPSGRRKRRTIVYLGLLPPPIGGRVEITRLYRARFGEPRAGRRVFIVTCQTRDGWKALERETTDLVPDHELDGLNVIGTAASELTAPPDVGSSQNRPMHKGGTPPAQGPKERPNSQSPEGKEPPERGGKAAGAGIGGGGDGKT